MRDLNVVIAPFRLYDRSQLESLQLALTDRLTEWQADWLPEANVCCRAVPLSQLPPGNDTFTSTIGVDVERWAHVQCGISTAASLLSAIYGATTGAAVVPMLRAIVVQCLQDLLHSLVQAAKALSAPTAEEWKRLAQRGSGTVLLEVQVGSAVLPVVLSAALVRDLLPKQTVVAAGVDPVPRAEALLGRSIMLDVELGQAEIELAALAELREGDVIVFDSHVDAPLTVRVRGGDALCEGYLGLAEGQSAV
ncbi:MAG TPA: FliM/FliN family flagellar motor C-terminal domain-containing protein, partial [Gammaproteobacteria bacterium]|nr:FliM/FliN family flagellar motor C-terminal domain-containing protein [Gammaproteobacteria bacterium]